MKTLLITAATIALMLGTFAPAEAAGCLKGAAVGGVAGHVAGHGVLGAAAGCVVGRHQANKSAAARQAQQTSAPTNGQVQDSTSR